MGSCWSLLVSSLVLRTFRVLCASLSEPIPDTNYRDHHVRVLEVLSKSYPSVITFCVLWFLMLGMALFCLSRHRALCACALRSGVRRRDRSCSLLPRPRYKTVGCVSRPVRSLPRFSRSSSQVSVMSETSRRDALTAVVAYLDLSVRVARFLLSVHFRERHGAAAGTITGPTASQHNSSSPNVDHVPCLEPSLATRRLRVTVSTN